MTNHCTHEQSLALKEIGFDMPTRDLYLNNKLIEGVTPFNWNYRKWNYRKSKTSAPTPYEVLQWAREKLGIDAWVRPYYTMLNGKVYGYTIFNIVTAYEGHTTYKEAEDALIDKLIEIFNKQQS